MAKPAVVITAEATSEQAVMMRIVVEFETRRVCEHRDEMRRPRAESGDRACGNQPRKARIGQCGARTREQVDGSKAGEKTHRCRQQNLPPVMLQLDAIPDS
jgi:hypothetical protein